MRRSVGPGPRSGLGDLLAQARFEIVPLRGIEDEVARVLPPGTTVTVTCSPRRGIGVTLDLAQRLAGRGYRVVPHLSARQVTGPSHLQDVLGRLSGAGLREAFVIGGDVSEPRGAYASAGELLVGMADAAHSLEDVGVGGYPEGHPLIEDEVLMEALAHKQRFATYVVTQICFDPRAVIDWIERIRERGIELPVYLGMAGAVRRRKLLEVSLRVGVGDSVRYLTKHGSLVARLIRRGGYRPDAFVARVAPFVDDPDFDVRGFHVFTFNQVESTERWRRQILSVDGRPSRRTMERGEHSA